MNRADRASTLSGKTRSCQRGTVNVIGILGSAAPVVPTSYFLGLCQFLCVRLKALELIVLGVQMLR